MRKQPLLLLSTTVLGLLVTIADAHINTVTINLNDRRTVFLEEFGFTHTGHANISIEQIAAESYTATPPDTSRLGLVLLAKVALPIVESNTQKNPDFCLLNSHYVLRTFNFQELSPVNYSCLVQTRNMYRLLFVNCASPLSAVTMTVRVELYNLNDGASRDYLSTACMYLPHIFLFLSLAYFSLLGFWICICLSNKTLILRVHFLIAGILLVKMLSFICAFEDQHHVKVTGTPHGWNAAFRIFEIVSAVQLFTAILLISSGWSTSWKALERDAKKVLKIMITLQVVGNAGPREDYRVKLLSVGTNTFCTVVALWDNWSTRELWEIMYGKALIYLSCMLILDILQAVTIEENALIINHYITVVGHMGSLVFTSLLIYVFAPSQYHNRMQD